MADVLDLRVLVTTLVGSNEAPGPVLLMRSAGVDLMVAQWRIGEAICDFFLGDDTEGAIGSGYIEQLSERLKIGRTKLYDFIWMYQTWSDEMEFMGVLRDRSIRSSQDGRPTFRALKLREQNKHAVVGPVQDEIERRRVRLVKDAVAVQRKGEELQVLHSKHLAQPMLQAPPGVDSVPSAADIEVDVGIAAGNVHSVVAAIDLLPTGPWRSESYLQFVRGLPCAAASCEAIQEIQAHHVKMQGWVRSVGIKIGDEWTIPLCPNHHGEMHRGATVEEWEREYGSQAAMLARTQSAAIRCRWAGVYED